MIKKSVSLLIVLMLAVILVGCGGPPDDVVHNAVKAHLDEKYDSNIGEILELEIVNSYTKEVDGDTVHTFDYEALVKHHQDILVFFTNKKEATYTGAIRLVKNGDRWYKLG